MENVGIIGLGVYIPENFIYADEIARRTNIPQWVIEEKFGVLKKPIPGLKIQLVLWVSKLQKMR